MPRQRSPVTLTLCAVVMYGSPEAADLDQPHREELPVAIEHATIFYMTASRTAVYFNEFEKN